MQSYAVNDILNGSKVALTRNRSETLAALDPEQ